MDRRRCALALAAWAGLGVAGGSGEARANTPTKVALVLGNGAYRHGPLGNPVADARAMAERLHGLGFEVQRIENAGLRVMVEALRDFSESAAAHAVRLVFYSGHGIQWRGRNYLVPVDAAFRSEEEIAARCADLTEFIERLAALRQGLNIVILDACQANPFAGGVYLDPQGRPFRLRGPAPAGMTRFEAPTGLARVEAPAGTLIAYSTSPGGVAFDGKSGEHSLYAKHLLTHITAPGLPIEQVFKRVRVGVAEESARRQIPWETSSLFSDFCFRPNAQGRCGGG